MASDKEFLQQVGSSDAMSLPGRVDCLDAVDLLVRRGALSPDARGHALLVYLVEHYLTAGPGVPIKAYAIAVDVLGRGSGFDPAQDAIVRVEIGRLRKLLEMYFLGPGQRDPVRFSIPKGQTHLEAEYLGNRASSTEGPPVAAGDVRQAAIPAARAAARLLPYIALSALIMLALAAGIATLMTRTPSDAEIAAALDEDYPRVFIHPFAKDHDLDKAFPGAALSSFVAAELSAFRSFRVIAPLAGSQLPVRPRDYVLDGNVLAPADAVSGDVILTLLLRDGLGTVLWTERLNVSPVDLSEPEPVYAALTGIAQALGGALGVIDSDGRARLSDQERTWSEGSSSDFRCILHWQSYDLTKDPQQRTVARACLEDRAAQDTPVGQVWSALAFLRYLDWTEAGAPADDPRITAALAAANRALLLDPNGPDGHEAIGSLLTGMGRLDEAHDALMRALALNPSNIETIVKIGWLDCLRGDWAPGTARIRLVVERFAAVPGWYRLPLALAAFRDGNAEVMLQEARAISASGDRRGMVLELIAARLANDTEAERRQSQAMKLAKLDPVMAISEIEALFPDKALMSELRGRL